MPYWRAHQLAGEEVVSCSVDEISKRLRQLMKDHVSKLSQFLLLISLDRMLVRFQLIIPPQSFTLDKSAIEKSSLG